MKTAIYRCLKTCLLLGLVSGSALAADPPPSPATELEDVVVTADRRPTPLKDSPEIIRVVTAEEIRRMNARSTGEILENVEGVTLETGTGSGFPKRAVISLGGLPPQYVLVLVNGQKLVSEHIHTGQNVDLIPPEAIERIEIIRTAASAQHGSDAIGGVINIITKPSARKARAKFYESYGSRETFNIGTGFFVPVGDRVRVSMFADWDRSNGLDILAPAHRLHNMGYERLSFLNNVEVRILDGLSADLYLNYIHHRMDWSDGEAYSSLMMPKADLHLDLSRSWRITGSLEYTAWEADTSGELNELLQPKLFASWRGFDDRNELTFGGEFKRHWFKRTGLDGTRTQDAVGGFLHDRFKLNQSWSFSASARLDKVEDLDPVVSPKVAALYRPIDILALRASVSRGFHAPTVQELYEQAYGHGGTALRFGSPDLVPETSTAFSLGAEVRPMRGLYLQASGYCHLVDNFIVPKYEGPWSKNPGKDMWVRTNILRAWLYGGEASVRYSPWRWLRLGTGYSYAANKDDSDDEQLQFHPGHSVHGRVGLRFRLPARLSLDLFTRALHRAGRKAWNWKPARGAPRTDETGCITELADYTMLDAGAELGWARTWSAYFTVSNILSEDIEQLDDALTILDGKPLYRIGMRAEF